MAYKTDEAGAGLSWVNLFKSEEAVTLGLY